MKLAQMTNASCLMTTIFVTMTSSGSGSEDDKFENSYGYVIFSVMVWNHADQLPERVVLPENYHSEADLDEDEFGLLTQTGKMRAFNLGKWARSRYNALIKSEPYNTSLLQMQSTAYDRTVSSGQLFFAGFYPPTDEDKERWHDDIDWQPISILSLPRLHDRMLLPTEFCARINRQMDHIINSSRIEKFHDDYKTLLSSIQEHIAVPFASEDNIANVIDTIHKVYNWFRIQKQIGLPIPEWAENIYPDLSRHIRFFKETTINPETLRLKGGPLLSDIISTLKRKRNETEFSRLFQFYVGHDTTIMLLLKTLGVFDDELIHFCAAVILELRIKVSVDFDPEYIITVWYKNSDDIEAHPKLLELPYCPNPCLFEDFIERTKDLVISSTEWVEECKNTGIDYNSMDILF